MNKLFRKLKKRNKIAVFSFIILIIGYILSYGIFAKNIIALNGIETKIRYIVLGVFVLYFILYILLDLINIINKKYKLHTVFSFLTLIFITLFILSSFVINYLFAKLGDFGESTNTVYTSYLISLKETDFNSENIIGIISDTNDKEGYQLANKSINKNSLKNELKKYDDYFDMIHDLYDKKIDAIFVQSNYASYFAEEFENIKEDTKVIYKYDEEMVNEDKLIISSKDFSEPISILVMGVDSESDGLNANAGFNGDTLILITFNPHTLNLTMFSMPRDIVVPIACKNNTYARINSSAGSGTKCVINTVENLTDIDIDYYVKVNFKAVVEIVDALGGVEVEVEEPQVNINHGHNCKGMVCEQNSDREWGSSTIYIKPGLQTLNGEEALAYVRNRGSYSQGDIARNRHQQEVITALVKKITTLRSLNDFENILNAVTKNIATNMTTNQILSGYGVIKDMLDNLTSGEEFISTDKTYLEYYSLNVYLKANANNIAMTLGYYSESLDDIKQLMKVNLGLEKPEIIKIFSFSANEEYEPIIAGKGIKKGVTTSKLQSFIGKTESDAKKYCNDNNIKCTFTRVLSDSQYFNSSYNKDIIGNQSIKANTILQNTSSLTFYINDENKKEEVKKEENEEESKHNDIIDSLLNSLGL